MAVKSKSNEFANLENVKALLTPNTGERSWRDCSQPCGSPPCSTSYLSGKHVVSISNITTASLLTTRVPRQARQGSEGGEEVVEGPGDGSADVSIKEEHKDHTCYANTLETQGLLYKKWKRSKLCNL